MKRFLTFIGLFLIAALSGSASWAATEYFMGPTGTCNDSNSGTSSGSPFCTNTKLLSVMVAGDTATYNAGMYVGDNAVPQLTDLIGTATAWYTFRGPTMPDSPSSSNAVIFTSGTEINLDGCRFVQMSDLIKKNGTSGHGLYVVDSGSLTFRRMGFKNAALITGQNFSNVVDLDATSGNTTADVLFEDVWIIGSGRYMWEAGGTAGTVKNVLTRRLVIRQDGSDADNPNAGISNYGATSGIIGAQNITHLNALVLDTNGSSFFTGSEGYYGSFYNPHAADNIQISGSIALNHHSRGFLIQEDSGASGNTADNCVVFKVGSASNSAAFYTGSGSDQTSNISHVTIATVTGSGSVGIGEFGGNIVATNSLFLAIPGGSGAGVGDSYNHFAEASSGGTNTSSNTLSGYSCMLKIPNGTIADGTASDGGDRGATILFKLGEDGTRYGQSNSTTTTANSLWPWPYQSAIKTIAAWADEGGWATAMSGNDVDRGFAAEGVTLTSYINDFVTADGCGLTETEVGTTPSDISTTTIHSRRFGVYGVNNGLFASLVTTWPTELNLIGNDIGAGVFRSNWDMWGQIESSSGTFSYTTLDSVVSLIRDTYGLDIIFTLPFAASWTPDDPSCGATNPFKSAALATTHCQTSDMGLVYRLTNNLANRYCDDFQVWELGNEPDYLYGSTDTAVYVNFATTTIDAIWDACPNAEITLPALSSPKATVLHGNITAGLTTYFERHWLADMLEELEPALPAGVTLSSFTYSIHVYQDAAGGGQTMPIALTTTTAILNNHGVTNPVFNITEYGKFGGSYSSGDVEAEEVGKSSTSLKYLAIAFSSTSPIVKRMVNHNLNGLDLSMTGASYAERYVYKTFKKSVSVLEGATAAGDQGSGDLKAYKFVQSDGDIVYITWCETADSCSWTPTPAPISSVKTDVYGVSTSVSGPSFTIGRDPAIYEMLVPVQNVNGVSFRGVSVR